MVCHVTDRREIMRAYIEKRITLDEARYKLSFINKETGNYNEEVRT